MDDDVRRRRLAPDQVLGGASVVLDDVVDELVVDEVDDVDVELDELELGGFVVDDEDDGGFVVGGLGFSPFASTSLP